MPVLFGEPVARQAGEHAALVGDRRRQDDVEGADAVRRDQQQPVVVERVEVAHLAGAQKACFEGLSGHQPPPERFVRGARVAPGSCRRAAGRHAHRSIRRAAPRRRRRGRRVRLDQLPEGPPLVCGAKRVALHDGVRVLAGAPSVLHQRGQQAAAGVQPEPALDVLAHALRPHDQAVDQGPEADEHVVEERRRAGQRHPLHRRVADVPLVPERLVLEARERVPAQQPGQAGQPLREDGVALVGHRAGTLLAGPEGLLELGDLRVLEVAHLGREALDRAARDRQRREERGVPVALHDLGADRVRRQPQRRECLCLDLRTELRVGADGAGDLARRDVVRWRPEAASTVAVELERPAGELEAEGDRLGVDRVRPAHHHGAGVLPGPSGQQGDQLVERRPGWPARRCGTGARARYRPRRCSSARSAASGLPGRRSRRPG